MFGFAQSWFAPSADPIGVDFGADSLRMAQVMAVDGQPGETATPTTYKLIAAARADVPPHVQNDPAARMEFFAQTVRELWSQGNFRGRRAILGLPASMMSVCHLRLPKMDDQALKKALPWEARGKLPYEPNRALLRHLIAGDIYQDGEQKDEVILMAASRESVDELLGAAAKARLEVIGVNVQPKALVDCFAHVYRRQTDLESVDCFIDIGCSSTRAVIVKAGQIRFARIIPIGGDDLTRAVSAGLKITPDEARILRIKHCQEPVRAAATSEAVADSGLENQDDSPGERRAMDVQPRIAPPSTLLDLNCEQVDDACKATVTKLVNELALCRRYHEATFPNLPVARLIFVGGEARNRILCQQIAKGLDLAAQLGDPMARMGRVSDIGIESGIDRRLPQPDWGVAIGLSMGPAKPPEAAELSAGRHAVAAR